MINQNNNGSNKNSKNYNSNSNANGSMNQGNTQNRNNQTASNRNYLSNLKEEVAGELGIDLRDPQLTAHEAGKVGGNMVRQMVEDAKKQNK